MGARISPVPPPFEPRVAEDLAKLMPPGIPPLGLFLTLAKNPRVLRRLRQGGLLDPGSITLRQRELVILRTTARAGAEYEWGVHVAFFAEAAKIDAEQQFATVWLGPDAACWSDDESLLVRGSDELHETARLSDATWVKLRSCFAEDQLLEVFMLAGLYRAVSYVVNGAAIEREPTAPRFPERR